MDGVKVFWWTTVYFMNAAVVANQSPQGHCQLNKRGPLTKHYGSVLSVQCECFAHFSLDHGFNKLSHLPTFSLNNETWPRQNDQTASITPTTRREYVPATRVSIVLSDTMMDSNDQGVYCCSTPNATSACIIVIVKPFFLDVSLAFRIVSTKNGTVEVCCSVETDASSVRKSSVFLIGVDGVALRVTHDRKNTTTTNHNSTRHYHKKQCFLQIIKPGQNWTCSLQDRTLGARSRTWAIYQPNLFTPFDYSIVTANATASAIRLSTAASTALDLKTGMTTASEKNRSSLAPRMTSEDRSYSGNDDTSLSIWVPIVSVLALALGAAAAVVWWKRHRTQQTDIGVDKVGTQRVQVPASHNDWKCSLATFERRVEKQYTELQDQISEGNKDIISAIKQSEEESLAEDTTTTAAEKDDS